MEAHLLQSQQALGLRAQLPSSLKSCRLHFSILDEWAIELAVRTVVVSADIWKRVGRKCL